MEMHNGNLYWPITESEQIVLQKPIQKEQYDVLVIGAGMSGTLTAYTLYKDGIDFAVLDKGKVGAGSTSANTGLIQYSNDIMLHELADQIGEVDAVRFYKLCREAVDALDEVAETVDAKDVYIRRDSLCFASEEADVSKLKREYEMLTKHGFDAEWLDQTALQDRFPFDKPAALITKGDAEVNPLTLSRQVVRHLSMNDVPIFEETDVTEVVPDGDGWLVLTPETTFKAKHVIFATGYGPAPLLDTHRIELNRSYAIATNPIKDFKDWDGQALIWETKRPYLYLRTTVDGRIIAGGLDEEKPETPHSEALIRNRAERIRQEVAALFPMYDLTVEYAWAALFGESIDHLPFIGEHPDRKNLFYLLGYGGNGTVYSMLGSKILSDLVRGIDNSDARLVRLDRTR
ncbi:MULTISPECIES: FAD-binding oxidoreductase [unclassified Exiguobacterium]|uniref:NAD(P)/FAD-dependent oxidoreductase n=1 Tax=unclassified Exiguobacterium TaxID=2644629 RepID=UPI00103BB4AE|nr:MULTISPECIES: FAD-dependent oxidoreductase [unclassified Exiguobacterium]TCI32980.1 FAD-binding oxidoreductase [Exiguobacterium sp. SH4S7]TCI42780.1 FAD-binding oxidoreductase [Exiguobacterium sp. SH5S32]TCI50208.1 FAD-binding oxidoreductase [Exiguobacterium sp. SH1S4]TCI67504.1 FAD-binding oxidoreductase [Exiguobacterium sp. SH1S1]